MIVKLVPSSFMTEDRSASISHTRLRLHFSVLKYHLFQKNCCPSPACPLCSAPVEDPKHYFLYSPSFAALREKLFASAAQLFGNRWHCASDEKKIDWFLKSIYHGDFDTNVMFFSMSNHLFLCSTVFANFFSFVHVHAVTCDMHCKQQKLSRWALLVLRKNVVINIV